MKTKTELKLIKAMIEYFISQRGYDDGCEIDNVDMPLFRLVRNVNDELEVLSKEAE